MCHTPADQLTIASSNYTLGDVCAPDLRTLTSQLRVTLRLQCAGTTSPLHEVRAKCRSNLVTMLEDSGPLGTVSVYAAALGGCKPPLLCTAQSKSDLDDKSSGRVIKVSGGQLQQDTVTTPFSTRLPCYCPASQVPSIFRHIISAHTGTVPVLRCVST